jgi:hypothetical protein
LSSPDKGIFSKIIHPDGIPVEWTQKTVFNKVRAWNKSPNDTEAGTVEKNTCAPS